MGTYGMPGSRPGIYLLDASKWITGATDHCLWHGNNETQSLAWTDCNTGADCDGVDCLEWGFEAEAASPDSTDANLFYLRKPFCTSVTNCTYAGSDMSAAEPPVAMVGRDGAIRFESVCVPCPGSRLDLGGFIVCLLLVFIAAFPLLLCCAGRCRKARRRPKKSISAWPVRQRSVAALLAFQLGWVMAIIGVLPAVLWNIGTWWAMGDVSLFYPLIPLGFALMHLVVRPDDSVVVIRAMSILAISTFLFIGGFGCYDALRWVSTITSFADAVGRTDFWVTFMIRLIGFSVLLLIGVCVMLSHMQIHGCSLMDRKLRSPMTSEMMLRRQWFTLRCAGLVFALANVVQFVLTYFGSIHWANGRSNRSIIDTSKILWMAGLLSALITTSPRIRLFLHIDVLSRIRARQQFAGVRIRSPAASPNQSRDPSQSGRSWSMVQLDATWRNTGYEGYILDRMIGQGHYSDVHIGKKPDGKTCAVKVFRISAYSDAREAKELMKELDISTNFEHPNLVKTFGKLLLNDTQPAMVMELMEGGSLSTFLHERDKYMYPITSACQHRIAKDVASALNYLHVVQQLSHRDVKPANVLLDMHGNAKLGDFGVTTRFGMEVSAVGTVRYMAPEVVFGAYGARADIFAFGMLTFEVLHAAIPFAGHDGLVSLLRIQRGARPPIELPPQLAGFALLITSCWHQMPERRPPSMATVVYMIEQCERTAAAREDPPCKV